MRCMLTYHSNLHYPSLRDYSVSAVRFVSKRTNTVGEILTSGPKEPTDYLLQRATDSCQCSQLPAPLLRSGDHVFVRDFTVLHPELKSCGIDPTLWNQISATPQSHPGTRWNHASRKASMQISAKYRAFPKLVSSIPPILSPHSFDAVQDIYADLYKTADSRVREDVLQTQRKAPHLQWTASIFDKAPHRAWLLCSIMAVGLWVTCFLKDPCKHEVLRARTHTEAHFLLFTNMLWGALCLLGRLPACALIRSMILQCQSWQLPPVPTRMPICPATTAPCGRKCCGLCSAGPHFPVKSFKQSATRRSSPTPKPSSTPPYPLTNWLHGTLNSVIVCTCHVHCPATC